MRYLLLILAFLLSQPAYACSCMPWSEEQSRDALEQAFFVGKVIVKDNQDLTDNPNDTSILTLEVIEPYKSDFYGGISAVRNLNEGMCGFHPVRVGEVVEVIIYKINHEKYHFKLKGSCPQIMPDIMDEYRELGAERAKLLEEEKSKCEQADGEWGIHGLLIKPFCIYPASDAGKACIDSSECEGACLATITKEQEDMLIKEFGKHIIKTAGKCSKKKAVYGCHPYVKNGKVTEILCVD